MSITAIATIIPFILMNIICVAERHPETTRTAGILWLTSTPSLSAIPDHVVFSAEKMSKNIDKARSMYEYILDKCAVRNVDIFTEAIITIGNWRSWYESQLLLWTDSVAFRVATHFPPFQWPLPFLLRSGNTQMPIVPPSERPEQATHIQRIIHDSSGKHECVISKMILF